MIYDKIKIGVQLPDGSKKVFDIGMKCYLIDIYTLLLRLSCKFEKYFIYNDGNLIDAGTRIRAVEKLEELSLPHTKGCI